MLDRVQIKRKLKEQQANICFRVSLVQKYIMTPSIITPETTRKDYNILFYIRMNRRFHRKLKTISKILENTLLFIARKQQIALLSNRIRVLNHLLIFILKCSSRKPSTFHSFDKEVYKHSKYINNITLTCLSDVLGRSVESDSPVPIVLLYKRNPAIKLNCEFLIELNIKHF